MGFCRRPRMAAIIGGQAAPTQMKQFEAVGHRTGGAIGASATVKDGQEAVYRMHLFAPNETVARSRFWYFVSQFKKLKRANGEILSCKQIHEAAQVAAKDVKRDHIKQFCDSKIKFPICHKVQRAPIRKHRVNFKAAKPQTW